MNAIAPFVWQEWRAQRGFLAGYLALAFPALAGWFLLRHVRGAVIYQEPTTIVLAFVTAALVGVVVAASRSVQVEHQGRDDQLLRRLPGALALAFAGKLGFLLVAMAALLLLGLAGGEALLLTSGDGCIELAALWAPPSFFGLGEIVYAATLALLWVFAVAFWMPRGRMAIGAVALLGLSLLLASDGIVRSCVGLDRTLHWTPWLGYLLPLAIAVGYAGCVHGRRGGDHRRSAKLGAATMIIGLLAPVGWLGDWVLEYRRPDLTRLSSLGLIGTTPDGRFALGHGYGQCEWQAVPFRIDLQNGMATQIAGPGAWLRREAATADGGPRAQRFWLLQDARGTWIYDAVTDQRFARASDEHVQQQLPAPLRDVMSAERAATAPFRQPGDLPAWIDGADLCLQQQGGSIDRVALPRQQGQWHAAGHGIVGSDGAGAVAFDLKTRAAVTLPPGSSWRAFAVDGLWLLAPEDDSHRDLQYWRCFDPATGAVTACAALARSDQLLGMLDEGEVLFCRPASHQLFSWRPQDGSVREIGLPQHPFLQRGDWYAGFDSSARLPYGRRDPRGRMWLGLSHRHDPAMLFLAVDPTTRGCEVVCESALLLEVAAFAGDSVIGVEDCRRVVRIDTATGARRVVFPR